MSKGLKHILSYVCGGFKLKRFNPNKSPLYQLLRDMSYNVSWSDSKESMISIVLNNKEEVKKHILKTDGHLGLDCGKKAMRDLDIEKP